jgi:serine/threonine protein kinase
MSRVLQQDIESKTLNIIGPIRWMAPESIGHQVYSKKSDVWMFGILIYEIIAQREPHVGIEPNEVLVLIRDNAMTPPIPSDCPQKLRELMQMCWKKNPEQRPVSFTARSSSCVCLNWEEVSFPSLHYKCDLADQRVITTEQGQEMAKKWNCTFMVLMVAFKRQ